MSVVRHVFYGSFGTQKSMVAFISKFDPRKGEFQVNKSNKVKFQNQNFLTKTCLSYPMLSQDSKNVIYFYLRQLEMPNMPLKKWRHHLYLVFCTAKKEIGIALKLGVCVVCMWLYNIFSVFLTNAKFWILLAFLNRNFEFWDQKRKISKIWYSHFVACSILRTMVFMDYVLLQTGTF